MTTVPGTTSKQPAQAPEFLRMGDDWRWSPHVVVRGAGFPADGVLRLADRELARQADELAADEVASAGPPDERWAGYRTLFAATAGRLALSLQDIAAGADFQRAVAWQNHHLIDGAINPFLGRDIRAVGRRAKHRAREELIALYWQRYCVKNDSIGFFGPVGWGELDDRPHTAFSAGATLVQRMDVLFEPWAIDRLAAVIEAQPGAREWLRPRRAPFIRLVADTAVPPMGPVVPLSASEARVLRGCDGTVRARDLAELDAQHWTGAPEPAPDRTAVMEMLDRFAARRWIRWTLDLPVNRRPEQALREFLDGVLDAGLRDRSLAMLDRLESIRDRLDSRAGAGARGLTDSLNQLDEAFTAVTGQSPTRNPGRAYGGRTLVYCDARRDISLSIGEDVLGAAQPLTLLAQSAHWLCARLADRVRPVLWQTFQRLPGGQDGSEVDFGTFWLRTLVPLRDAIRVAIPEIQADYWSRWATILEVPAGPVDAIGRGGWRVQRSAVDLAPRVAARFPAGAPGWAGARYFSPDVMVAARDLAAVHRGDFQLVLGEAHVAINAARSDCLVSQHPDVAALLRAVDDDFPQPRLLPVLPKGSPPRLSIRTHPGLIRDTDFLVETSHQTVAAGRPRLVAARDIAVIPSGASLALRMPTGEIFDVLDAYCEILMDAVIDRCRLFDNQPHVPRITVDKVVFSREKWRFDSSELPFARQKDEVRRFVQARAWRRSMGLSRQVFITVGSGAKPVYVDFDSPVYVDVLARFVRRSRAGEGDGTIAVSEMLPTHDGLWLTDRGGRRYTCELRLTAVDLSRGPAGTPLGVH